MKHGVPFLLGLISLSACKSDVVTQQGLFVTVNNPSSVAGIVRLKVILSNEGTDTTLTFPSTPQTAPIAFPTSFSVSVPATRSGEVDMAISGFNGAGAVVANATAFKDLQAGTFVTVTISLQPGANPGPGGSDGGAVDAGGAVGTGGGLGFDATPHDAGSDQEADVQTADVTISTGGVGGGGGSAGFDVGGLIPPGAGGAKGTGGVAGLDANLADAILAEALDAPLGGSRGAGGAIGSGGIVGTGGAASTGGIVGTGGTASTGGIVGTGGAASTGGIVGTGGGGGNTTGTTGGSAGAAGSGGKDGGGVCFDGMTGLCGAELAAKGTCATGTTMCSSGAWGACSVTPKTADTCDSGNDDNCDGIPNEGCVCINGATATCGSKLVGSMGTCAMGTTTCMGGVWGTCSKAPAAFDSCVVGNDDMCTGVTVSDAVQQRGFVMPNPTSAGLVNPASYTTNSDGSVTDNVTGLTWATTVGSAGSPAQTAAACATGTWRLPTVLELVSLVDFTVAPAPEINQGYFPGTPAGVFATSSSYAGSSTSFWSVDFGHGSVSNSQASYVRCVRDAAPRCYPTRYQTLTAGFVYDAATGLTWQQTINTANLLWSAASTYCTSQGPGWRVPSVNELQTIVDYAKTQPAIDGTAFPNTPTAGRFWTSSPDAMYKSDGIVWLIVFDYGETLELDSTVNDFGLVRCVH